MSEKQVERVQTLAMSIIGALLTLLMAIGGYFVNYVLDRQDSRIAKMEERVAKIEEKYQAALDANTVKIASIDKNLAVIAAKLNVDLK